MNLKKKIVALCLSCLIAIIAFADVYHVCAANKIGVSLPDDSSATIDGFTYKRSLAVTFNCSQPSSWDVGISTSEIVGYGIVYIGRYKRKDKVDGDYYDALLIKSSMEPATFYGLKGKKFYGFSQYLELSSTLPIFCNYQGSTPNNATTGSDSYSVSIGHDGEKSSVTGSVNCESKHCKVYDYTRDEGVTQTKFDVVYDYKSSIFDVFTNSDRNKMLFEKTWQMSTCEWTTGRNPYNVKLNVKAEFGYGSRKNGAYIYGPASTCTATNSKTYSCYFVR